MIKWEPGERIVCISTPVATGISETNEWEVVKKGRIKVLQTTRHLSSYLDIGVEYDLIPHDPTSYLELWEVDFGDPNGSQVLLYDWNDEDDAQPSIEVDF